MARGPRERPLSNGCPTCSVGVVVPAYNGAHVLADALHSLERQTVRPAEVVVVDDSSDDNTAGVARAHPLSPRLISLPRNHGVAYARNVGAAELSTEYLAFLDQDDMWLPTRLERLAPWLQAHPECDAVATGEQTFAASEDRAGLDGHMFASWVQHWAPSGNVTDLLDSVDPGPVTAEARVITLEHLLNWTVTVTTSYVIRREAFFGAGGCAPWLRSADDWILLQNLARHGRVYKHADATVLYRIHPGNSSMTTDWPLPILAAAVGARQGCGLLAPDEARNRLVVGALSDSEFLMDLIVKLGRSDLRDTLALTRLLAVDGRDRRVVARRLIKARLRASAPRRRRQ